MSALNVPSLDTGVVPDKFVGEPPVPVAVNVHAVFAGGPAIVVGDRLVQLQPRRNGRRSLIVHTVD